MTKLRILFKVAILIFGLVGAIGTGTAAATTHLEITTGMQIVGDGTYDSEVLIQGAKGQSGLKYIGIAYTPSLGMHGPSKINISQEYMFVTNFGNESELQVAEESNMGNIMSKRCFKNYELGSLQAFNTIGDYNIMMEFGGDYNMSAMAVLANVSGKTLVEVMVKDVNATHNYLTFDRNTFEGTFRVGIDSLIINVEEPKADGEEDWLECPSGLMP